MIGLIIVGLAMLKIFVWDRKASPGDSTPMPHRESQDRSLAVDIYVAENSLIDNTIYASGTIVPNEEVELKSEVSGRLTELYLDEGRYIRKGQIIAKLDDRDLLAQIKRIEYEEQLASQTEARQKKLLDIDAISREEYDLAMNQVNTLSADKELLAVRLDKTQVSAPFGGHIGFKNISVGAYLTPNTVIATLVQTNPVKIDFAIPEKYASEVSTGQEVTFEIDGTDDRFAAKVIAIDPKVDEDLRTLRLRAKTRNDLGLLKPGMFVRVEVPLEERSSIMIPTEAIVPILKGKMVYVKRNGMAVEAEVTTGLRTDQKVQILDGLTVGDSVIVSALMSLKAQLPVRSQAVVNDQLAP